MAFKNFLSDEYAQNNKDKLVKILIILLIIVVGLGLFVVKGNGNDEIAVQTATETEKPQKEKEVSLLIVDVGGAVKNPAVVELESDSRVDDAINAAGGLTDDADISEINRAAVIEDGQKIYIPFKGSAVASAGSESGSTGEANSGKVNLNLADSTALQTLNGVGPVTAEKIIRYRKKHNGFKKLTDLKKIDGIGDKTYEKLKDYVCL